MQSKAATVAEYLGSLPADRRAALEAVRKVILANLDSGFREGMGYGMIGYAVPHSIYPPGYHCDRRQPLPFAGLASQKGHMSLYLMSLYDGDEDGQPNEHSRWFQESWSRTGKKLDMGKCCIRFKRVEDLPLDVIGQAVRRFTAQRWIEYYEASRAAAADRKPAAKRKAPTRVKVTGKKTAKRVAVKTSARAKPAARSKAR